MPSKDNFKRPPEEQLTRSGPGKPSATAGTGRRRETSAQVLRLAQRMGTDPDELAARIDPDTLRRTKYPVIEIVNEDGTRTFKHDPQIAEGPRAERRI